MHKCDACRRFESKAFRVNEIHFEKQWISYFQLQKSVRWGVRITNKGKHKKKRLLEKDIRSKYHQRSKSEKKRWRSYTLIENKQVQMQKRLKSCFNELTSCFNGKKSVFNFIVPMTTKPCKWFTIFCLRKVTGFNASLYKPNKSQLSLSDATCAPRPWSHCLYIVIRPVPDAHDLPDYTQRWDL